MEIALYIMLVVIFCFSLFFYRQVMDKIKEVNSEMWSIKRKHTASDSRQYEIIEHLHMLKQQNEYLQDKVSHTHKVAVNFSFGSTVEQYVDYIYHSNHSHHDLRCILDILTSDLESEFMNVRIRDFRTDEQFAKDIEFLKDQFQTLELARIKWGL